jgi:hypothetical protein
MSVAACAEDVEGGETPWKGRSPTSFSSFASMMSAPDTRGFRVVPELDGRLLWKAEVRPRIDDESARASTRVRGWQKRASERRRRLEPRTWDRRGREVEATTADARLGALKRSELPPNALDVWTRSAVLNDIRAARREGRTCSDARSRSAGARAELDGVRDDLLPRSSERGRRSERALDGPARLGSRAVRPPEGLLGARRSARRTADEFVRASTRTRGQRRRSSER